MGTPTVRLVHHSLQWAMDGVLTDVTSLEAALERWLRGDTADSPQLPDVARLRTLMRLSQESDSEAYWIEVHDLAQQRLAALRANATTVGQLMERLRGLNPNLLLELVFDDECGVLEFIEVPPTV